MTHLSRWLLICLLLLAGLGAPAWGQSPTPTPEPGSPTPSPATSVDAERNRLTQKREELQRSLAALRAEPETPSVGERIRLTQMLLRLVEHELVELQAFDTARQSYALPVLGEQEAYSLELADDLRSRRERARQRLETLAAAKPSLRRDLQATEDLLLQLNRGRGNELSDLRWQVVNEEVERNRLLLSLNEKETLLARDARRELDKLLSRILDQVQFPRSELEARKRDISRRREEVRALLQSLQQKTLRPEGGSLGAPETREGLAADTRAQAQRRADTLLQRSLESELEALDTQARLWDLRFQFYQGHLPREAFSEATLAQDALKRQLTLLQPQLEDDELPETLQAQLQQEHQTLQAALQLADRLIEEQRSELGARLIWSLGVQRTVAVLGSIWNFELLRVGDQVLTVKKVVLALLILGFGIGLARRAIRQLHDRALVPLGIPPQRAAILEKTSYYLLITLVVLAALRMVNIPLTFFTFLGGSVAIAVGFGAQTLINNFIGGLILTFEQPIRVGDLIEIDGTYGVVKDIGARCTHIQTSAGVHILVPNSKLLENNLINWTLGDATVRTSVKLAVAYGSDADQVTRLILEVLQSHPAIHKNRGLTVLLTDFASDGIEFEAMFWLTVRRMMDRRILESDVRLAVYNRFREHGVEFPFPQRDLHFRSEEPLSVRLETPPS